MEGGLYDDLIDGGDGEDIAVYSDERANYNISIEGEIVTVQTVESRIGIGIQTDTLRGIETIRFSDQEFEIDRLDTTIIDTVPNSINNAQDLSILNGTLTIDESIGGLDGNDFFRFELLTDSEFELTLNGLEQTAGVELLDRQGVVIETISVESGATGEIELNLAPDSYFMRVFRSGIANTPYTLQTSVTPIPPPFQIRDVTPDVGSNAGVTTVTITGNRFTPDTEVGVAELRDESCWSRDIPKSEIVNE